jgi:hypothetical protein
MLIAVPVGNVYVAPLETFKQVIIPARICSKSKAVLLFSAVGAG